MDEIDPGPLWAVSIIVGPLAGALATLVLIEDGIGLGTVALALATLLAGNAVGLREPWWSHLLPLMSVVARLAGPALGALSLLLALRLSGDLGEIAFAEVGVVIAVTAGANVFASRLGRLVLGRSDAVRVAVIGTSRVAESLQRELRLAPVQRYTIIGHIGPADRDGQQGEVRNLGQLSSLGRVVADQDVHLLLMAGDVPRLAVFDEFVRSCLHLPVRLNELSAFYEHVFGHVAVADINGAWFQYLMHSGVRGRQSRAQRLLDLAVVSLVGLVVLPLLGLLALLIRRDGGPALFRQVRIGERGRPFTVAKLRTMRVDSSSAWAAPGDHRVTPIGRLLRRTHLDELPQLLNVLRGEMSVVGPRPEQPEFVERLEQVIPFYTRRHLLKPGLTGWAQVRCGYAGSELGSAWKVAHDLYYLKHRSIALNLVILGETLRTLVADPQYTAEPASVEFILAPTRDGDLQGLPAGPGAQASERLAQAERVS